MKVTALLACCLLLSGSGAILTYAVIHNGGDADKAPSASLVELEALAGELRLLGKRQSELEERLASVESRPVPRVETAPVPAVAKLNEEAPEAPNDAEESGVDLDEELDLILGGDTSHQEHQQAWRRLANAGLLDEAITEIERHASEHPHDPDAQANLGHSYIQKVLAVNDLEKGLWAMKAHGAYDKALALDDHHWEARFSKAMSYAFAPSVLGLQPKAVEHLEILRGQQEAQPAQEHFAHTYSILGNVYQSMGNQGKAREVWQKGAELFPDSPDLHDKLGATKEESN